MIISAESPSRINHEIANSIIANISSVSSIKSKSLKGIRNKKYSIAESDSSIYE